MCVARQWSHHFLCTRKLLLNCSSKNTSKTPYYTTIKSWTLFSSAANRLLCINIKSWTGFSSAANRLLCINIKSWTELSSAANRLYHYFFKFYQILQGSKKQIVPRTSSVKSTSSSVDRWPINPNEHKDVWTSRYLGYLSLRQAIFFVISSPVLYSEVPFI